MRLRILFLLLMFSFGIVFSASAQDKKPGEKEEVIRVETQLVDVDLLLQQHPLPAASVVIRPRRKSARCSEILQIRACLAATKVCRVERIHHRILRGGAATTRGLRRIAWITR